MNPQTSDTKKRSDVLLQASLAGCLAGITAAFLWGNTLPFEGGFLVVFLVACAAVEVPIVYIQRRRGNVAMTDKQLVTHLVLSYMLTAAILYVLHAYLGWI